MALDTEERDGFDRSVLAHRLAGGRGCAQLLASDEVARAMVLERLGPNLDHLGMTEPALLRTIAATLRSFWRPVPEDCGLPSGADKAAWLAAFITMMWDELGRPCGRDVIDRAVGYCAARADAFDPIASSARARRRPRLEHVHRRRRDVQVHRSRGPAIGAGSRPCCADA